MRSSVIVHPPEEFEKWVEETKLAQISDLKQAIAAHPPDSEFLAPYAQEIGITADTLAQLHSLK